MIFTAQAETEFGLQICFTQHAAGNGGVFFSPSLAHPLTLVGENDDDKCRYYSPRSLRHLSTSFALE